MLPSDIMCSRCKGFANKMRMTDHGDPVYELGVHHVEDCLDVLSERIHVLEVQAKEGGGGE